MVLLLLVSLVLFGHTLAMVPCYSDSCDYIRCTPTEILRQSCSEGRIQPGGSVCGCCATCIAQLDVGERCRDEFPMPGPLVTTAECKAGLYCNDVGICQKTCSTVRHELLERLNTPGGEELVGYIIPRCQHDGLFAPVQCSESVCFCTNTHGNRLYSPDGTLYQSTGWNLDMNCRCARFEAGIQQSSGCKPNGNFA